MEINRRDIMRALAAMPALAASSTGARAQKAAINYWHHFTSTTEFKGLERVMALFKQKYPDIAVTQDIPNPEYMSRMTAAVLANARPDTCMVVAERAGDLVAMGALVDLTDRIKAWPRYAEYPTQAWQGATVGGKIYLDPAFTFVDWMYYRKDWFAEKGIAPPTTYQEFLDAAIKVTDPSKNRYGLSMRGGAGGFKFVIDLIESSGIADRRGRQGGDRQEEGDRGRHVLRRSADQAQGSASERAKRRLPTDHGSLQDRPDRDGVAPYGVAHGDPGGPEA